MPSTYEVSLPTGELVTRESDTGWTHALAVWTDPAGRPTPGGLLCRVQSWHRSERAARTAQAKFSTTGFVVPVVERARPARATGADHEVVHASGDEPTSEPELVLSLGPAIELLRTIRDEAADEMARWGGGSSYDVAEYRHRDAVEALAGLGVRD